jgi:hypothetical protein
MTILAFFGALRRRWQPKFVAILIAGLLGVDPTVLGANVFNFCNGG